MKYYIEIGDTARSNYQLKTITKHNLPSLKSESLNKKWVGYFFHIMDDLATDFNLYMFFTEKITNLPQRFYFTQFGEALINLCKLLDIRRNNEVCLQKILSSLEQNIKDKQLKAKYLLFKQDIDKWIESKKDFINKLQIIRDKFLVHIDIDVKEKSIFYQAMHSLKIDEIIEVANITIEILCALITSVDSSTIPSGGYTDLDEFTFIYGCLRSLDKVEKNVTMKNKIIHNIDLELREIKKIIEKAD